MSQELHADMPEFKFQNLMTKITLLHLHACDYKSLLINSNHFIVIISIVNGDAIYMF